MSTTFTNTGNFTGNLTGTGTNSANTNSVRKNHRCG